MLNKRDRIDKLYYSIGEVAELFEVNPSLIRYWEKEFDTMKPAKNRKGNRVFTKEDLDHLRVIYHLVKERGYTLQGARDKIRQNRGEVVRDMEITQTLIRMKEFLLELKKDL